MFRVWGKSGDMDRYDKRNRMLSVAPISYAQRTDPLYKYISFYNTQISNRIPPLEFPMNMAQSVLIRATKWSITTAGTNIAVDMNYRCRTMGERRCEEVCFAYWKNHLFIKMEYLSSSKYPSIGDGRLTH